MIRVTPGDIDTPRISRPRGSAGHHCRRSIPINGFPIGVRRRWRDGAAFSENRAQISYCALPTVRCRYAFCITKRPASSGPGRRWVLCGCRNPECREVLARASENRPGSPDRCRADVSRRAASSTAGGRRSPETPRSSGSAWKPASAPAPNSLNSNGF